MPYIRIETNVALSDSQSRDLFSKTTKSLSQILNKSEEFIQVSCLDQCKMAFGNSEDPCIFSQVFSLGLSKDDCPQLAESLTQIFVEVLKLDAKRVYICFGDWPRDQWSWNGRTFA